MVVDDGSLEVVPYNVHAFQSRLCLFIMMVTGEGMIQVIATPMLGRRLQLECGRVSAASKVLLYRRSCW